MIKSFRLENKMGFTLIEIIIAIIIIAIAGTMLVTLTGSNLINSTVPVTTLDNLLILQQEMESINAQYYSDLAVIGSINSFKTFLDHYSSTDFSVTYADFNDGSGANSDIIRVVLTSNELGTSLVTLMSDITN